MKPTWKKYLLYASLIIVGGGLIFLLIETIRAKNTGFETKTLWDWMELLVIPVVLAVGAFFLNRSERKTEREIATDRQQEAALQAYLDRMADLLLKEKLLTTENEEVRNVARVRTLTVLRGLDSKRKRLLLAFLEEAGLLRAWIKEQTGELNYRKYPSVDLSGADFSGADLEGMYLFHAHLIKVNFSGANLVKANLDGCDLSDAILINADSRETLFNDFPGVPAKLNDAKLEKANLSGAYLHEVQLINADLSLANLNGAILSDANLKGAIVTEEQLAKAKSLKGAIMPDGTKHE